MRLTIFTTPLLSPLLTRFSRWILRIAGWKLHGEMPSHCPKSVIIAAPHTSNWDFPYTLLAAFALGLNINWMGKIQIFRFPFNGLMCWLGGIAVDRSKNHNLVEAITRLFSAHDKLIMLFPAEGTRSPVNKWKTGFYYVALQAKVPVYMAYLDYEKRTAGIGAELHVTGDIEKDFSLIREFYSTKSPRIEKNFNREGIKPH